MSTYRDICAAHYAQKLRGHEPRPVRPYYPSIRSLEELLSYTKQSGDCLTFRGNESYSRVYVDQKAWATHRLSYHLATGEDIEGIAIHHKCANSWCVKPDHLEPATAYDNNLEMLARKSYEARIAALEARVKDLEAELDAERGAVFR